MGLADGCSVFSLVVLCFSHAALSPCDRIREILCSPSGVEDFVASDGEKVDDDTWLYNGEENLSRILEESQQERDAYDERKKAKPPEDVPEGDNWDPTDVTRTMHAFVEKISTFEGAELPNRG